MRSKTAGCRVTSEHLQRRGAVMVVFVFSMVIFVIMATMAINVAYMELVRAQLRSATDFAAKAGARTLAMTGDEAAAIQAAIDVAAHNLVAGQPLTLAETDIELGRARRDPSTGRFLFTAGEPAPNACRVVATRSGIAAVRLLMTDTVFQPTQEAIAAQLDRDIALVLDRSGSMVYTNELTGQSSGWRNGRPAPSTTRWASVAIASSDFLDMLAATPMDEQVALVTFATSSRLDHDLTFEYQDIRASIDAISRQYIDGSTNIAAGIESARQALRDRGLHRPSAEQTIVLMTDGFHNTGTVTVQQAATAAAADGLIIHTITYGREADEEGMRAVAETGHGQFWSAPDRDALRTIFQQIADNSPTLLIK